MTKASDIAKAYYSSPIGILEIKGNENGVSSVSFINKKIKPGPIPECLALCINQLDEYFRGKRKEFSVHLNPQGTDFQKKVWDELVEIPFGKTTSYIKIARQLKNEKAIRAVGGANGKNPIAIIIPCHRVIGSSGRLVGYAGGMERKKWLLDFENANPQKSLFTMETFQTEASNDGR